MNNPDMKIAVVPNRIKDVGFQSTQKLCSLLASFAATYADTSFRGMFDCTEFIPESELYSKCDIVITLGGDGTLLSAAQHAARFEKPILGINLGRLGFLSGSEKEDFFTHGINALKKGFDTEKRMMLEAEVIHSDGTKDCFTALNDVVITRTSFARIGKKKVYVNGELLGSYTADGVLVSTPTGSTGYSLSAGGPIADPELELMLITPICPHMLGARPIAVPPFKEIRIEKSFDDLNDSAVTADGKNGCPLKCGEYVIIRKSKLYTTLIKLDNSSFYKMLREKLM